MKLPNISWMEVVILGLGAFVLGLTALEIYLVTKHDCTCVEKGAPTYVLTNNIMVPVDNCVKWDCKK